MGLDVYLHKYENRSAHAVYEKLREEAHEKIDQWGEGHSDEERARRGKLCDAWDAEHPRPADAVEEEIQIDSKVYPDHMFKVGYLRSSYNDGGINRILENRIGTSLHEIFFGNSEDHEYIVRPDWGAALVRAREARDKFAKVLAEQGELRVLSVRPNPFTDPATLKGIDSKKALEIFLENKKADDERLEKAGGERSKFFGGNYSNGAGEFFFAEPIVVLAAIHGEDLLSGFLTQGKGILPTLHLVYRYAEPSKPGEGMDWYVRALEITIEMIEWVLGQPDVEKYHLHWSS